MSHITYHEQGGYIEGRQIIDGIIVSHEAIHSLKFTKKPGMLILTCKKLLIIFMGIF